MRAAVHVKLESLPLVSLLEGRERRTLRILTAADLDEGLDVGDFARHDGRCEGC